MKANGITDPKKIQIGQVLKIPASTTKAKSGK
jgi:LysM repeat protein